MSDIRIPAAALEAGAKTLCSRAGYEWTVTPDVHNHWRAEARAAFLAIVENWEGMTLHQQDINAQYSYFVLPLTEKTDDKA